MSVPFPHVFSPFRFRAFEVENRLVMPPMCLYYDGANGFVTQSGIDYYEARAAGGVGMIVMNSLYVHVNGRHHINQTGIDDDKYIPDLARLVQAVHRHGTKFVAQLAHAGRQRFQLRGGAGGQTISPSGIPCPVRKDPAPAPTVDEIHGLVEAWGEAARRAKEAGFDGIELHCAHGYLLAGFLSPYQNKRTDEYGGDVIGRTRIVREILARCREKVGPEMHIQVRINGSDYVNDGNTPEEVREIARLLVAAGAEAISVSAGMCASAPYTYLPSAVPPCVNVPLAEMIREVVDVPVIACGAISDVEQAEEILARGKVELVAMGRALMADPELPMKAKTGRAAEIVPCLRCAKCAGTWPENPTCTVNPWLGQEAQSGLKMTDKPKKVVVIGAGPAGLEAARTAAMRGHSVTVFDEGAVIGGKILTAQRTPGKERLSHWLEFYENEMNRLGVRVVLDHRVSADDPALADAGAIVVATGAKPLIPTNIAGVDDSRVVVLDDALWDRGEVGDRVLVIGGASAGMEGALYLARQGKRVVVAEKLYEVMWDVGDDAKIAILDELAPFEFNALTETEVLGVEPTNGKVNVRVRRFALERVLPGFDTVVLAIGARPDNALGLLLKDKFNEVYLAGDCEKPYDFRKAVDDGRRVGMSI